MLYIYYATITHAHKLNAHTLRTNTAHKPNTHAVKTETVTTQQRTRGSASTCRTHVVIVNNIIHI